MSFKTFHILDLSLARDPTTKPQFLNDLRHALLEVSFLYLENVGIPEELIQAVIREGIAFFDLPDIEMKNVLSFLGCSKLVAEITKFEIDLREQIDLSTDHPVRRPHQALYCNLFAPTQWPSASYLPKFKPVYSEDITKMGEIGIFFTSLISQAIGLRPDAFNKYFDKDQHHKLKIVKYHDLQELGLDSKGQVVGPHKDSMLTSYLLQIDCPPIDGTLVVAIGQGMEAFTQGVCMSTTHRVLSPPPGSGARFSVPFFQALSLDAEFAELNDLDNGGDVGRIPEKAKDIRRQIVKHNGDRLDDCEFTFQGGGVAKTLGEATLRNRIKSNPDVGERWYPEILKEIRALEAKEKYSEISV
ncbi:hypothetical protein BJ878DRAFT_532372 [Calycina marina]|uniref:Uncharacterized protein n=1 Tax=Calycina marina TaxID=1763456 RepID=A0A9P8CHY8_9HELO|nr:hypothetical protein BJ878DRAFT_532372 [Calycina marina]